VKIDYTGHLKRRISDTALFVTGVVLAVVPRIGFAGRHVSREEGAIIEPHREHE
jgi:hypothetical protein